MEIDRVEPTVSHRFIKGNLTGGVGRAENLPDCLVSYQHIVTWGDQSCCCRRGRDTVTLVFRVTMLEPLTIVEAAAFSVMSMGRRTRFTAILRSASVTCNPTWPSWRAQVSSFYESVESMNFTVPVAPKTARASGRDAISPIRTGNRILRRRLMIISS